MKKQSMSWLAVACCGSALLLTANTGWAQNAREQDRQNVDQPRKAQSVDRAEAQTEDRRQGQLPKALEKLDLSEEQEQQIRQSMRQHNQKLRQTWQEFNAKHMQAVDMEAAWVAAVRDTLSDQDKQKFDQSRMQDQEMRSRHSGDQAARDTQPGERAQRQQRTRDQLKEDAPQTGAANRDAERNRDIAADQKRSNRDQAGQQKQDQEKQGQRQPDFIVLSFTVTPEKYLTGTQQSPEQQKQCSEVCAKYQDKLSSLWSELHQLHHELVKIEAQRLESIEKTLDEEQLTQLRDGRSSPQQGSSYTSTGDEQDNR